MKRPVGEGLIFRGEDGYPSSPHPLLAILFAILAGIVLAEGSAFAGTPGVRGEIRFTGSYIEYGSVVRDSVSEAMVPGNGVTRVLPDGTVVSCIPGGDCYWYRSGSLQTSTPLTQDLELIAWPGTPGVSVRVDLRSRLGSEDFWPHHSREFEALNAYVTLDRDIYRLRAGRQARASGLGVYPFDGGSALVRLSHWVRVEVFAGRSLAQTLNQSRTGSLLEEADVLAPDKGSVLWGFELKARRRAQAAASLIYQRELRTDRAALYSERLGFDGSWTVDNTTFTVTSEVDLAAGTFNDLRGRARLGLGERWNVSGQMRRYRPYFDLWTIWGAFNPVGFLEGRATAHWNPRPRWNTDFSLAYRDYEETHAGLESTPVEGDGWRGDATVNWLPQPWTFSGTVGVHRGAGAYRSRLDVAGGRRVGDRAYLGAYVSGTQQFAEYRFGDGRTRGAGLEGRWSNATFSVHADAGVFRHVFENRPGFEDYDQVRARLRLRYRFGTRAGATWRGGRS